MVYMSTAGALNNLHAVHAEVLECLDGARRTFVSLWEPT